MGGGEGWVVVIDESAGPRLGLVPESYWRRWYWIGKRLHDEQVNVPSCFSCNIDRSGRN